MPDEVGSLEASRQVAEWAATRMAPGWAVLALLVGVAAGCRLDMVAEVDVAADGSADIAVVFHLDEALLDELDALGVDATAELAAAAAADHDWSLERAGDDATLRLTLRREVPEGDEIGPAFRELTAGLAESDPALLVDLEIAVDEHGAATLDGTVGLRPPQTAGAVLDGEPVGPTGEELAAIVAASVTGRLVVRFPGDVEVHDADGSDGATLTWQVPVGDERSVAAVAAAPTPWPVRLLPWGAVAIVAVGMIAIVTVVRRRRRA